ncbi:type VI secretion system baseplate subunit TssG [Exilibacterium tricleocarpae]|uniref:Type VI secretion system baseplate subunit TssG n=1 Tax=Exilibacterium tricleocarpae TaxID=2591008 RepID=A0A545SPX3_9GAMM|nr:type VI secretion system baseplate subunit TssG [Exilibacterium tricleocarpae]TQV66916.1 type VI secretion system baseplate subunit TssG [Exilibacterium tricleocarpae]
MATTRRRKSIAVIQQLTDEPHRFEFFQALRILESATRQQQSLDLGFARHPVGGWVPPHQECVRFRIRETLGFRTANVVAVEPIATLDSGDSKAPEAQWEMIVGFMGLTGSQGVLPYYFTELVLQQLREKSDVLKDFLDTINHRSISLFYQASRKYQLPVNYERQKLLKQREPDLFSHALSALSGLGTGHLSNRLQVPDEVIYGFGGLLARQVKSAVGLKGLLRHYFGIDVTVEQFCPQWQELPDDVVTRLPGGGQSGQNNKLGVNALLGSRCKNIQSKFRIHLEPMSYERFMTLAPGGEKMQAMQGLIEYYAGTDLDYEISVTITDSEVPPARLNSSGPPMLGWNSHVFSEGKPPNLVEIKVSQGTDDLNRQLDKADPMQSITSKYAAR